MLSCPDAFLPACLAYLQKRVIMELRRQAGHESLTLPTLGYGFECSVSSLCGATLTKR